MSSDSAASEDDDDNTGPTAPKRRKSPQSKLFVQRPEHIIRSASQDPLISPKNAPEVDTLIALCDSVTSTVLSHVKSAARRYVRKYETAPLEKKLVAMRMLYNSLDVS